jgi:hypothetical protein
MTDRVAPLPVIPIIDARVGGTLHHAQESRTPARALRDDCLAFFPRAFGAALPCLDRLTRRWLFRSRSPYAAEIEAIAETLGFSGVWFLNGSYQWGCTALAREEDGVPWLARTLDWPFPGLGRHVEIVRMQGPAGDYFNLTWPGYVGALNAMAPGRFGACVNQAPLRRRTRHPWLRTYDMAANAVTTWARVRHMPPDQLLRLVFETCGDFAEAETMLEQVPVARPVIFTLVGCRPGERCVIERTEDGYETRREETAVANDWCEPRAGWEARMAARHFLTLSSAQAAENSHARRTTLGHWRGTIAGDGFDWLVPPVLNLYTRLAVVMCPARGELRAAGYEMHSGHDLPLPATQVRALDALPRQAAAHAESFSRATAAP